MFLRKRPSESQSKIARSDEIEELVNTPTTNKNMENARLKPGDISTL
jgi:hypothetical protein